MKVKSLVLAAVALAASGAPALAAGDAANGEKLWRRCMACHSIEKGGPNKIGPNLFGVVGNDCGVGEGFKYSPGYQKACQGGSFAWTEENIMAYLPDASAFLTEKAGEKVRSRMTFRLPKESDRQDIIAYLKTMQ